MSSRMMLRLTLLGIAFIIVAVGILFAMRLSRGNSTEIEFPPIVPPSVTDTEVVLNDIDVLTVSADNIREIVAELNRPEVYSRDVMVESFWEDGSAVYNFNVSVRGGVTALRTMAGGTMKNIIITDEVTYIWSVGDSEPVKVNNLSEAADDVNQMLITYENIARLERAQILSAELITGESGSAIFVRYMSSPFGYVTEVLVSIELGIVLSAEQYDGETLIYRMTPGVCSLEVSGDTVFMLPNGQSTLE